MNKLVFLGILTFILVFAGCASSGGTSHGGSGTATVKGMGFFGEITVTVSLESGRITRVEADGPYETEGIGSRAIAILPGEMVRQNKVDVDVVSGATMTSQGLIETVKAAIAEINK